MLKCESCLSRFQQASDLFQHIQSSCLSFYKKHPEHWAEILSKMTSPVENKDEDPEESSKADNTQAQTEEINETKTAKMSSQSNPTKKEVPFCIMFKAQRVKKGQPVLSLQMTVSDYYYGTVEGKRVESKQVSRACKCSDCGKSLRNNIRFMSHLRHKILNRREKKEGADARNICNHCFREYSSPFLLQCHLENVHGTVAASTTCKICDCHYPTDRELLSHMKDVHVQNEAPYGCKVCAYRSSFFNDITRHFREKHTNSTGLMCPFCLFVAMSANAFSKHVLQHVKKGFACSQCRLIFNTTSERLAHQNNDHVSQHMKEKMAKYKNSHLCQIYVKAAPYKDDSNDRMLQSDSERRLNGITAPKVLKRPFTELPAYLCPAKRSNCVRKIRTTDGVSLMDMKCSECGEVLKFESAGLRDHFRYQHECKWCVHVTSCEQASHDHVLREHANAEMREQIFGKTDKEDTPFPIILQDDEDNDTLSKIKEEPEDILPAMPGCWGNSERTIPPSSNTILTPVSTKSEQGSPDKSPPTKARRKQSNPTKISDFARPVLVNKAIRRDRCVQTKGLEKDKGVQACDQDFQNLHGNVDQLDSFSLDSKGKVKKRKVFAQPGYFPDIDDDTGWAKYFANVEDNPVPGKPKSKVNPSNGALPTMVPRQGTFSILNKALKAQHTGSGSGSGEKEQNKSTESEKQTVATSAESSSGNIPPPLGNLLRTAPLAPNNLRCIYVSHEHMLVQWDPPANGAVTQYKIVFQGLGPQTVQILPVQQTLVKLVGLKSDVMYSVRVYTFFYTGVSDYANMFVKTKPAPSSVSGCVKSLTTSQISLANTGTTSTNSEIKLLHSANTSVTPSNVQYKTSVGVPFSTYLALKSATVGSAKITAHTGLSSVSVRLMSSVSSMPKTMPAELKNSTPGDNFIVNNCLVTAETTTTRSSQIQCPMVSLVKSTAIASLPNDIERDPNFKYSASTVSTTKDESNDVYLVLDDEDDGAVDDDGSSKAKTTVQPCVTMDDGDVIMVLDDNDGSMADVGKDSLAVNEKQSLHIDTDVSMSSQSDSHEERSAENTEKKLLVIDNKQSVSSQIDTNTLEPADVGRNHFANANSASNSKGDGKVGTSADIAIEVEVNEAPIDVQAVSVKKCQSSNGQATGESIENNPDLELKAPCEADKSYHGACKGGLPVQEDGSNLTPKNPEDMAMKVHTDQQDQNNQDDPDGNVHATTDKNIFEQMDDETEGCVITSNLEKSSEQKDQDNVTDTVIEPYLSKMQEGDETQGPSELLSAARESDIVVNDHSINMDCDAPLIGTEESMSTVDAISASMESVVTSAIDCDSAKDVESMITNLESEENGSGEIENCVTPGQSANSTSVGDQLLPSGVEFLNTTQIASKEVSVSATPTVESDQSTGPIPSAVENSRHIDPIVLPDISYDLDAPSAGATIDNVPSPLTAENSQQKGLDISCSVVNKSEPCLLKNYDNNINDNVLSTGGTVQTTIQHIDVVPTSEMELHDSEHLHGNALQHVETMASDCNQQEKQAMSTVPDTDENLSGADLMLRPEIRLDNIDELLDKEDMFWL